MMMVEAPMRSLRVLVVEDESRLRELLLEEIPDMGFAATGARSAEEARRIMEVDAHEIILLDLRLPGEGGMELFEFVKANWPRTQVVVLSGYGDLESARRAIHLEVVEFLSKPCRLREVELALDRARRKCTGDEVRKIEEPLIGEKPGVAPLKESERELIVAALAKCNGNRTAAAAALGMSRRTLHHRLKQYRDQGFEME